MDGRTAAAVLGVAPGATKQELVRAYRARAKQTHPDAAGSDEAFVLLRTAYEHLLATLDRPGHPPATAAAAEVPGPKRAAWAGAGTRPWFTTSTRPARPVINLTDTPVTGAGPIAAADRIGGRRAPVRPNSTEGARQFSACLDAALARSAA